MQKPFKPATLLAAVADCLEAAKRLSSSSSTAMMWSQSLTQRRLPAMQQAAEMARKQR